ncbi:hypothetical protein THASP1DRAFT_29120 [Thamnocephalis sphaerospora]|uniref:Uncharacterized protein n=1 Tax=Thamnocephalis sphaerospora TaxID=78915 RepID=A0A4P9XUH5_9FUNG|nr:hypothetical protein THASP1DRAFT_29120 [Thamnocephalis sphaerospora]|eukprot:RKP09090.1 hypothetical protein THASP1DRAFT_29120 [Thamnocephalis sphaerospora]
MPNAAAAGGADLDVGMPSIVDPRAPSDATEAGEINQLATNRGAERLTKRRRLWTGVADAESVADKTIRLRDIHVEDGAMSGLADKDEPYCGLPINDEPIGERRTLGEALEDPAVRRTFKSPYVERLAFTTMSMIEQEKTRNQRLDRLAGILQQDDPWYRDVDLGDDALVADVWEKLQDHICYSSAYLRKLTAMRDQLMRACRDRTQLWARMEELHLEQEQPMLRYQLHHGDYPGVLTGVDDAAMAPVEGVHGAAYGDASTHGRSGRKKTTRAGSASSAAAASSTGTRQVKTKKKRAASGGGPVGSAAVMATANAANQRMGEMGVMPSAASVAAAAAAVISGVRDDTGMPVRMDLA